MGQFTCVARGPVQSRDDRRCRLAIGIVVVEKPGGQRPGRARLSARSYLLQEFDASMQISGNAVSFLVGE
jgi:hypothetical protein